MARASIKWIKMGMKWVRKTGWNGRGGDRGAHGETTMTTPMTMMTMMMTIWTKDDDDTMATR